MITISDLAAEKLQGIFQEEGQPEGCLRIIVVPGPQGGFQHMLTMENQPKEEDAVVHANGIKVVVDPDSAPLVAGSEIDYIEGLMRSGFVISNPNAPQVEGGCACGGQCSCGGEH